MEPFVKVRCQFFGWCAIKNAILNWKCSYTNAFFAPVCEHATRARCVWCDAGRFVSPTELSMPFIIRCFFFALGASYFLIFIEMREFVIGAPSNDGDFNQWNWWLALEKCDLISMLFFCCCCWMRIENVLHCEFHWNDWVMQYFVALWIQWFKVYRVTCD